MSATPDPLVDTTVPADVAEAARFVIARITGAADREGVPRERLLLQALRVDAEVPEPGDEDAVEANEHSADPEWVIDDALMTRLAHAAFAHDVATDPGARDAWRRAARVLKRYQNGRHVLVSYLPRSLGEKIRTAVLIVSAAGAFVFVHAVYGERLGAWFDRHARPVFDRHGLALYLCAFTLACAYCYRRPLLALIRGDRDDA